MHILSPKITKSNCEKKNDDAQNTFVQKSCLLSVDESHTNKEGWIVCADLVAESEDDLDRVDEGSLISHLLSKIACIVK